MPETNSSIKYFIILPSLMAAFLALLALLMLIYFSMISISFPAFLLVLILILCFFIHRIMYCVIPFVKLPESKLNLAELSADYQYLKYASLVYIVMFAVIFAYLIKDWMFFPVIPEAIKPPFFLVLVILAAYFLVRTRITTYLTKFLYQGGYPSYKLSADGIMIEQMQMENIYLDFNEIESITSYTPQQAYAFYYLRIYSTL